MFGRILILVGLAVLAWSVMAHSSQAHGAKQVVTVKPYDTLWSIAQREAERLISVEKVSVIVGCWTSASRKSVKPVVERANHLQSADVSVGQKIVLP